MTSLFSLILMATLTSNILIAFTVVILKNKKIIITVGYPVLIGVTILVILRLLLLLELPITITIRLPKILSLIVAFLRHPFWVWQRYKVSIWSIFICIWIVGALILVLRYIYRYRKMYREISACCHCANPYYISLINEICKEQNKKNNFCVIEAKVDTPCLFGIINPYIIMPKDYDKIMNQQELYFILRHETAHHFNFDLVIKLIVNIIVMLYWWNPICWIMRKQADVILDMRVDQKLTISDSNLITAYLKCLVKVAENKVSCDSDDSNITVSACKNINFLTKRFEMLITGQKRSILISLLSILLAGAMFCLSYSFVFEAFHLNSEAQEVVKELGNIDIYAQINDKGTYDIYFNGIFLETVDSLEQYPVEKIYDVKGEMIK